MALQNIELKEKVLAYKKENPNFGAPKIAKEFNINAGKVWTWLNPEKAAISIRKTYKKRQAKLLAAKNDEKRLLFNHKNISNISEMEDEEQRRKKNIVSLAVQIKKEREDEAIAIRQLNLNNSKAIEYPLKVKNEVLIYIKNNPELVYQQISNKFNIPTTLISTWILQNIDNCKNCEKTNNEYVNLKNKNESLINEMNISREELIKFAHEINQIKHDNDCMSANVTFYLKEINDLEKELQKYREDNQKISHLDNQLNALKSFLKETL